MLVALVQSLILAAPACAVPDVAAATLRAGYIPAPSEDTYARCSGDAGYLFQNDGSQVTNSFLLEWNTPLRERASFERAVHQLAIAVNGLWVGIPRGEGAAGLGPCADDLVRFLLVEPPRNGERLGAGAGPPGALAMLALLRSLGLEDEVIWKKRDARSPPAPAVIVAVLGGEAIEGAALGPGDDKVLELLRVGNVVEVRTSGGSDWFLVASRPSPAQGNGAKRWRFMSVHVSTVERSGGRGLHGAQLVRTARMRAWFAGGRWRVELASRCGSGPEGAIARAYDTWEVLREQPYALPPYLPMGALQPELPMSGDWSPWPELLQKPSGTPASRPGRR